MAIPLPLTAADPTRLGGYELVGRIGTGGQGVVYLGRPLDPDGGLPPRVAVKLLHAQLLGNAGARARFVRELALLQRVAGFCTAQMLEADMVGDQPYIVSEYVEGRSLRELVVEDGPRRGADLDRLAIGSVTALTAIHRAGVVHRDFKPQNVLMGRDGPRVIDFGIARAFDSGATVASQVVGTPAYMAPEQFSGGAIGPSADLFAWAATLLFAATGRDPFAGGPLPAVMFRIMKETPDLSVLPGRISEVASACLAKDPKVRPTSEDALLWLLGERDKPPHARRTWPSPAPPEAATEASGEDAPRQDTRTRDWADQPGAGPLGQGPQPVQDQPDSWAPTQGRTGAPQAVASQAQGPPVDAPDPGAWQPTQDARPQGDRRPVVHGPQGWYQGDAAPQQGYGGAPQQGHGSAQQQGYGTAPQPGQGHVGAPHQQGGGVQAPWPPPPPVQQGAPRPRPTVRRGPAVVIALILATLLAALDFLVLATFIANPNLPKSGSRSVSLAEAGSFALAAVIMLIAVVVLAWRGSRAAAWTVIVALVLRVALWGVWAAAVSTRLLGNLVAVYAAAAGLIVLLLGYGIGKSGRSRTR